MITNLWMELFEALLKVVDKWIQDIEELHRAAPAPSLQYTKPMPGVDALLAVWPHQLQTLLSQATLPSAALEVSLESYVDLLCCMLDIPVYKSRIQVPLTGRPIIIKYQIVCRLCMYFSHCSPHSTIQNISSMKVKFR